MCDCDERSGISIMLPIALAFGVAVVSGSYAWTWANHDLPDDGIPFISDLGNRSPQWWFFGAGLTVVSAYFIALAILRFQQLRYAIIKIRRATPEDDPQFCCSTFGLSNANWAGMVFFILAAVCLTGLSWFNDLDFRIVHNVFAVGCFASLALYQVMHTVVSSQVSDQYHSLAHSSSDPEFAKSLNSRVVPGVLFQPTTKGMFAWYVVFNTISFVAAGVGVTHYLPAPAGAPAVAEWALALGSILYFCPLYYELQNCTLAALSSRVYSHVSS